MNMKNTKAIFFIVLGAFLMATGFAFAAPSSTFDSARSGGLSFDGSRNSGSVSVIAPLPAPSAVPAASQPTKPEDKPMAKTKKFVGDNFSKIVSAAAIGVLAFLVIGTGGAALAVGAAAFGFFFMMAKL
ncbi:MAG TPA: hypothetical protein DCW72_08230 [Elusimicrobia bacterium]|nr:MAG: hypothetical protein A2X29_05245 [Elusimicrobia bacterium GWA2_64_40]OGR63953.1 MAG: hypothetical protein A2X30_07390 [Elusimicrobia bacterium GWB2_63_16]HAN04563.1 hypothetical protein [Elusimicrobiota bacterium]HAU90192.1 hypothetical protein [Elusimicrobiota bacterium]